MAEQAPQEERTEAATPRRLQRAREEGQVAISRELPTLAGLATVTLTLVVMAPSLLHDLALRLSLFLSHAHTLDVSDGAALRAAGIAWMRGAGPFVLAALFGGAVAIVVQTGFVLNHKALRPDVARISPRAGLKRLLGADAAIEAIKSLVKVAVLSVAVWGTLRADMPALLLAPFGDSRHILGQASGPVLRVLLSVLAVQTAVTLLDVVWVFLRHARGLRMSRYDIREEQKETEGDPRLKARIRQIRVVRARRRMLAAVPKATVVVTNPTHYAVALVYDRSRHAAPRVVAKGVDTLAARIREVAEANKVPIVANPPLARALYRVELDTDIPADQFQAVAEIIAYVWRLSGRARGAQAEVG